LYKICITDLEFDTIIGILDFERKKPQKVKIECFIKYKDKKNFIDYAEVVKILKENMQKKRYKLIEDALDDLIEILKKKYKSIKSIKMTIFKIEILPECVVSVTKLKKF